MGPCRSPGRRPAAAARPAPRRSRSAPRAPRWDARRRPRWGVHRLDQHLVVDVIAPGLLHVHAHPRPLARVRPVDRASSAASHLRVPRRLVPIGDEQQLPARSAAPATPRRTPPRMSVPCVMRMSRASARSIERGGRRDHDRRAVERDHAQKVVRAVPARSRGQKRLRPLNRRRRLARAQRRTESDTSTTAIVASSLITGTLDCAATR